MEIEVEAKKIKNALNLDFEPNLVSCGVNDYIVAISGNDGKIDIFKLEAGKEVYTFKATITTYVEYGYGLSGLSAMEFTKNDDLFASSPASDILTIFSFDSYDQELSYNIGGGSITSIVVIDENMVGAADTLGYVHLWDLRLNGRNKALYDLRFDESTSRTVDCNKMIVDSEGRTIFLALENGSLGSLDMRNRKILRSELNESGNAYNVIATYRDETKLCVGDSDGIVHFYDWKKYGYQSDSFKTHPSNLEGMIPITENIGILGYEDGSILAYNFFPHKTLGVVGKTNGILKDMDVTKDGRTIVSVSQGKDNMAQFWDVGYFENYDHKECKGGRKSRKRHLPSSNQENPNAFFSGL